MEGVSKVQSLTVNYQNLVKLRFTSSGFWFSSGPTSFIRTDSLVQLNRSVSVVAAACIVS